MKIRYAEEHDIPVLMQLGKDFVVESTPYVRIPLVDADVEAALYGFIKNANTCVLMLENEHREVVGTLIAVLYPQFYNTEKPYVMEVLFYIVPRYRGEGNAENLISTLGAWAQEKGAYGMGFGALPNSGTGKLYKGLGFFQAETHWSKVF